MGGGAGRGGPWWGLTLSLPQGSLLKVVLEDYLRLKKLFAQRMVQKASSCHSSISEVAGGLGAVCCAPALGVLSPSLSFILLGVSEMQLGPKTAVGGGPGRQDSWVLLSGLCSGLSQGWVGAEAVFLRSEKPQEGILER